MASSKPPPPDPNVGLAAKGQADVALRAEERANANDTYFRENFAPRYLQQIDQQIASGREAQEFQMGLARKYDQRFWDTTAKFQDKFYDEVNRYDTEAAREEAAGRASADVQIAGDNAGQQAIRGLQRQGVNPNSGAMLGARRQYAQTLALSRASAMTMAREAARREGLQLKAAAAGMGGGLAAATQGMAGQSTQAGMAGVQALNGAAGAWQGNTSGYNQTLGLAQGAYTGVGNLGMGLTNQANQHAMANAANQNQVAGSVIGAVATAAMMYSDRRLKTNVRRIATRGDGTGLYEFEYIWGGPKRVGVMADEVLVTRPGAVVRVGEFYAVDYAKL
jgi:hypothetical protein